MLRFHGQCDFAISGRASSVAVHPHRTLSPLALEHLLVDQVLPRCLAQRGQLVAHGACVAVNGQHVLFIGESGRGKSTLAGLMHHRGHRVLTDDCVLLRPSAGSVLAAASYPSLRLNADSALALFPGLPASRLGAGRTKQRIDLPHASAARGQRIALVYHLGSARVDDVRIQRLSPSAACIRLMEQCFQLDVVDPAIVSRLLKKAAHASALLPSFSLDYPRRFDLANQLVDRIERHVASVAGATRHRSTA